MSNNQSRPPRYALTFSLDVETDLSALATLDLALLDAAEAVLGDLAYGRVTGKPLGHRHVSGDLSGLARVKFDLPGQWPQRFRLVYRQFESNVYDIVAIGPRDEHAIYRVAVKRLVQVGGTRRDS
ncbi:MAG: hypothetical protein ACREN8_14315 [Candidatus Dormibacteraceae bacterium]